MAVLRLKGVGLVLAGLSAAWASAQAGEIGAATSVQRNASAQLGAQARNLDAGMRVREKETLSTDASGGVTVQLFDSTLLSMGPLSRVTLDRFVANSDGAASRVAVSTARGAFRFATGVSDSRAYTISTPVATLGVRGTRFGFDVSGGRLRVSVTQGAVEVCPRGGGACQLAEPGRDVTVSNRRASTTQPGDVAAFAPLLGAPVALAIVALQPVRGAHELPPLPRAVGGSYAPPPAAGGGRYTPKPAGRQTPPKVQGRPHRSVAVRHYLPQAPVARMPRVRMPAADVHRPVRAPYIGRRGNGGPGPFGPIR